MPSGTFKDTLVNRMLALKMRLVKWRIERPFRKSLKEPAKTQWLFLQEILKENKDTVFGLKHKFGEIKHYEDFQKNVPTALYENMRSTIEKQDKEKKPYLTKEMPFMFSQTSGTTGEPKRIPVLRECLRHFKHQQELSALMQYRECPEAFQGKILGIVSPAVEGHLPSGTPYGSISGYMYKNYPRIIQSKYVLPAPLFEIQDYALRYYLTARLALTEENVTLMATATPSTFHEILDEINAHKKEMIEEIGSGNCKGLDKLATDTAKAIMARIKPNPKRARQLTTLAKKKTEWDYPDFWPHLKLVSTWMGSSSGISLKLLRSRLPKKVKVMDLGYIASEFRGTIAMRAEATSGAPTIDDNFFEFVETHAKEKQKKPPFRLIHELEDGKQYYIFVTTRTGLYRYDMQDIMRADGLIEKTPALSFVQKGKGFTNITGEKLHESQLIDAMEMAGKALNLNIQFYKLLADQKHSHYELYVQLKQKHKADAGQLADFVDSKLQDLNVEYKIKRAGGQLKALQSHLLKTGTFEKYKLYLVGKGQRESQFKVLLAEHKEECDFDFGIHKK